LNGTHQIGVYAGDINFLGCSINTIKENTDTVLEASRDVRLVINAEKTKYIIVSSHPKSGQNQNIKIENESFKNGTEFKYLGMTLTNQNDIHYETKSVLNSGNACSHSVQNLLSSQLIPIILYGCETWSLMLREEHRVFENRVLRRIFRPEREENGSWRKLHNDELGIGGRIILRWTLAK
jgi:hypothetical protein